MRVVLIGATDVAVMTARLLTQRRHEVVIVDRDLERIHELQDELDCGFLHGDGTKPELLREADPDVTDLLFCLTENDPVNIIASLVGRSLGFARVITRIQDPQFEPICDELGLDETIVPVRTIARFLADRVEGVDVLELSTALRHDARLFQFEASSDDEGSPDDLDLPGDARVICYYRQNTFHFADPDDPLHTGDSVIVLARQEHLDELQRRWRE